MRAEAARPARPPLPRGIALGALLLALAASGIAPLAAARSQSNPEAAAAATVDYGKVGYAKITGLIDRMRDRYLGRVLDEARAEGVDTLVVHIDTDGGQVRYAREMFKRILDQIQDGPRMIAFVDFRAISAGAMIAYAHEEVYMAETASIGDIGVIFRTAEGEIKYAPEKIETVIRTLLIQAAEQRGWSRGLLLKMTAHKQKLYRVTLADGRVEFVIEDDLPEFLAEHPDIDEDDDQQVLVYRGEDRLLTLTGREAEKLGMATATVATLEALYAKLGVEPAEVASFAPRVAERTAWYLAGVAPLLAGLAMLFIMFELKTPGVGLWALLALACGGAFLLSQYYLDMVENMEIVLIALGLALVATEALTMIGGGTLAVLGALIAFAGLVLSFLPNEFDFDFTDPAFLDALGDAAMSSLISVAVVITGVIAFINVLPRTRLHRRLTVERAVTATSAGALEASETSLVGRRGSTVGGLSPGGTVTIGDEDYTARVEHGAYAAPGSAVEVVKVEFGELVVRALEPEEGGDDDGR